MMHSIKARRSIRLITIISILILFAFLVSCSKNSGSSGDSAKYSSPYDLNGKSLALVTGSFQESIAAKDLPDSEIVYYSDLALCLEAVDSGKVSATICPSSYLDGVLEQFPELTYFDESLSTSTIHFTAPISDFGTKLINEVNEYLTELKASGEFDELYNSWTTGESSDKIFVYSDLPGVNGTISFTAPPLDQPYFCRIGDGYSGIEAEFMYKFCEKYGYSMNVDILEIASIIAGIGTGKYDLSTFMVYSDERAETMLFSDPYTELNQVVVVPRNTINVITPEYPDIASLDGKTAALYTGSINEVVSEKYLPDNPGSYYSTFTDCLMSVSEGKTDFTVMSDTLFYQMSSQYPNLTYQKEPLQTDGDYFGIANTEFGQMLQTDLSEYINSLKEEGWLEESFEYWNNHTVSDELPTFDFSELDGSKGVIRFAMEPLDSPYAHMVEDKWTGFEAEIIYNFAKEYDYSVDISLQEFTAILAGISSGKVDLTGYFGYTDERAETVLYSPAYCDENFVVVVRTSGYNSDTSNTTAWERLCERFEKNFIKENRWKLMVQGLLVTIELSLASGIIGTLFGILLCLIRRSRSHITGTASRIFIRIIQGIPVVVILLVLYYIIFRNSTLDALIIGVIGFSVDFGVYVCEILRSGIEAVDNGQWEAASALGFNKAQTYTRIILPQAINISLPVYKGQFIAMVKMTSVVGYIAVQDLTKVSDIIRSRTYDAFMPILVTCAIYFLLAWALTAIITRIEFSTDPTKRKHVLNDVDTGREITGDYIVKPSLTKSEDVIRIEHLTKEYELATPLKDVSTVIRSGDIIAVIGPSGTGKSTLLRCINGLETPTEGEIFVMGHKSDPRGSSPDETRLKLGMVFQSFNLFNHLTVIENIMLAPVMLRQISRQEAYENGIRLLRNVGLAEKAFAYPSELSGGQKQRVAIVRAVAMNPEVLLFDEPTSALDPTMINEVFHVIRDLAVSGITMLIVTHEMKFARDVSNRVFYMDQGQIYEDGATEQIFEHPSRELTRSFIARSKLFNYTINTDYFDFVEFRTLLKNFCHAELISDHRINNTLLCLEEIGYSTDGCYGDDIYPMEVHVEYTQDEELIVTSTFWGPPVNPFEHLQPLAEKIVTALSYNRTAEVLPDGRNQYRFYANK